MRLIETGPVSKTNHNWHRGRVYIQMDRFRIEKIQNRCPVQKPMRSANIATWLWWWLEKSIVIDSMEDVRSCLLNMRSIIRNMVLSVPVHHCVSSVFCIDYSLIVNDCGPADVRERDACEYIIEAWIPCARGAFHFERRI